MPPSSVVASSCARPPSVSLISLAFPAWDGTRSNNLFGGNPWIEFHAALALFSYGVFALLALGGWMGGVLFDWTGSYRAAFINGIGWNVLNAAIAWWLLSRQMRRPATA